MVRPIHHEKEGIAVKNVGASEMATQIVIALIQNGGFKVSGGMRNEQATSALIDQVCEAYERILNVVVNGVEPPAE